MKYNLNFTLPGIRYEQSFGAGGNNINVSAYFYNFVILTSKYLQFKIAKDIRKYSLSFYVPEIIIIFTFNLMVFGIEM